MNITEYIAADPAFQRCVHAGLRGQALRDAYPSNRSAKTLQRAAALVRGIPHKHNQREESEVEQQMSTIEPVSPEYIASLREFQKLCSTLSPDEVAALLAQDGQHIVRIDREKSKAGAEARKYKSLYNSAITQLETVEEQRDFLLALDEQPTQHRGISIEESEPGDGVAHLIASDWHIEEKVDPAVVDDMNEFNPEIAAERARAFFANGQKRVNKHRRDVNIQQLYLWLLGDFITGYIHEELEEDNYLSPTEATLLAEGLLSDGIRFLLDEGGYEKIVIPCCRGNHGRTTKKKRISTEYKNSYEWMMYHHLARLFADDDRVEFIVPKSSTVYVDVMGKTIRGHHGDAFRSAGGIGGIMPSLFKWLMRANEQRHAEMTYIGHWHQHIMPRGDIVVNGSLIGLNSYAKEIGCKPEAAKQFLHIQSRERGFTTLEPIFCE